MYSKLSSVLAAGLFVSVVLSSPITKESITAVSKPTSFNQNIRVRAEPNTGDDDLDPDEEPHPNKLDKVERAFNDAFELAGYATTVIDDPNRQNIFTKYFNEEDRANVRKVFATIWTQPEDTDAPAADGGSPFLGEIMVQQTDSRNLCGDARLIAYLDQNSAPNDVALVLCPRAFNKKGVTAINGQDPQGPGSENHYLNCAAIGDNVSFRMNSLGMTLLHEYTHYNRMLESIFNAPIIDQEDAAGNPIGYGPVQVRTLDKTLAKLNADSYAYFASEALWTVLCQKDYGDPVPGQDDNDPDCNNSACTG
ncbi:Nn.00g079490.m01.CDS01 [Neocucurbitaria sp. VM-36]